MLECLNIGRLRVATKGVERSGGAGSALGTVSDLYHAAHGLFMLGQVATLRNHTTTIEDLHRELCAGSTELLEHHQLVVEPSCGAEKPRPSDVAIVGMASFSRARSVHRGSGPIRFEASTPSPRFRLTAGTGACITTPTPRPLTRSSRNGVGSCPTSRSTQSVTGCLPRVSARSSRHNCWHSK